jgi:hypothetical protein
LALGARTSKRRRINENQISSRLSVRRGLYFLCQHPGCCAGNDFQRSEHRGDEADDNSRLANLRDWLSSERKSDQRFFDHLRENARGVLDPLALAHT